MKTVEEAYEVLAKGVLDFIGKRSWDKGCCKCEVFNRMASSSLWLVKDGRSIFDREGWPDRSIDKCGAALFLRDDLLQKTGRRIWGLTFTLYPNGRFTIEYDYHKPEGFEETDETIRAADAWDGWVKENNKDGQE